MMNTQVHPLFRPVLSGLAFLPAGRCAELEPAEDFAPVFCVTCSRDCRDESGCAHPTCTSRLCQGCMAKCDACGDRFCWAHVFGEELPECAVCRAIRVAEEREAVTA